jgi:hypothetical protein
MNTQTILLAGATAIASLSVSLVAKADTVNARCDVYPRGADRASAVVPCTFSQRQGVVGIQLQNGKRYDLSPTGNQPGNYVDQDGQAAYRQAGLGDRGQIYRLANESIYVYWDTASLNQTNQSPPTSSGTSSNTRMGTLRASDPNTHINLRSKPTVNSQSPGYGIAGDRVEIVRCVNDQDTSGSDLNWCNVRFEQSGAVGWIRSDFIIFPSDGF